jgi:regulator of nucleoside diphosphate kinase
VTLIVGGPAGPGRHPPNPTEFIMTLSQSPSARPPIHLLATESDIVAGLALRAEHRQPVVASMLLEEIERAELHDPETMPGGHIRLNSTVAFVDERTEQVREVKLVLPGQANISEGRISILTPMGAALYGLAADHCIDWPDLNGNARPIRILRVVQPEAAEGASCSAAGS